MKDKNEQTAQSEKKKSRRLVGLFAAAMLTVPAAGCDDDGLELCYDNDADNYCDDDHSTYNPNNYVVINGKKVAYIKDDSSYVSSGDDDSGGKYKGGIGKNSGSVSGG
ncbi:hypothetical protein [Lihuaxuella thermophila]|uniref:Uncharacterized protein n=1 Tax=Lihuaxuella thermophila TaxID=1173111 RepID=A0A1H8GT24_9BACL|nr:hypothetical protein [Lihuaxuella thermophila]SEN46647.1 hypothetical protein SAMN05444955_11238 [Lihuaxuella thermophila]